MAWKIRKRGQNELYQYETYNGKEFDIKMVFDMLEKNRYISDGEPNIITIKESDKTKLGETNMKVITY